MTHVCCYVRQSDEEGYRRDLSCPLQQETFLRDVSRRLEAGEEITYEIAPWDEGKSGGEFERPGLQWVLANLERFQEVWVYDHDRLARHEFYAPLIMWELRRRGVRLWCSTGGADEETPMGRFMTDLRLRFGALYREQVSERTKMNRDQRLREGLWSGHPPTGYMYVDENGPGSRRLLVPDPANAPRIQAIFRMLAEGYSQRKACAELGITQTSVIWQRGNPLYIGLVYKNRENMEALPERTYAILWSLAKDPAVDWLYPGRHEPLVDEVTWDALELRRQASPKNRVSRVYGLSGRFRCAKCGGVLRISRKQGKRNDALRCDRCRWERSYRYAEEAVLAALEVITGSPEFEAAVEAELAKEETPAPDRLGGLRSERARVGKQLDRALDLLMDSDEISVSIRQRAVAIKTRRDALDREIAEEAMAVAARPSTVAEWRLTKERLLRLPIGALWTEATAEEQRDLLAGVFSQIRATPEELTFAVRGLGVAFTLPWHVYHREVAGPGRVEIAHIARRFRLVGRRE